MAEKYNTYMQMLLLKGQVIKYQIAKLGELGRQKNENN